MTTPLMIGLPEHVAVRVLKIYGADPEADLPALLRSTEASMEEIAATIVRQCFEGQWRGRMSHETASRIKLTFENSIKATEGTPPDPLAQMAATYAEVTSSSEQAANAAPTVIPRAPGSGLRITDTRDDRSQDHDQPEPSVIVEGGGAP